MEKFCLQQFSLIRKRNAMRYVTILIIVFLFSHNQLLLAQSDNLRLDARQFFKADLVVIGKHLVTRPGPLQPTDSIAVIRVLKSKTDTRTKPRMTITRGEFTPPVDKTESVVYLQKAKNGKWQLIQSASLERLSVYADNKKYGFKDQNGKPVIKARYDDCYHFSEGLAPVAMQGKWGVIDAEGTELVKPQYGRIQPYSHGRAAFEHEGKHGFLNIQGEIAIALQYENALGFRENYAPIQLKGRWGYIDVNGQTMIDPQYEQAGYFSEGLASVRLNKKVGYVNSKGELVIKPQYDGGALFRNGKARVMVGEKAGVIDVKGNWVSLPKVLED